MKFKFLVLFLMTLLVPICAEESTTVTMKKADNFTEGQKIVTDKGYIIFAFADKWDQYSKKIIDRLIKHPAIIEATENVVCLYHSVPQFPSPERNQADKEKLGKLTIPKSDRPISYPAIFFYNKHGDYYGAICGSIMMRGQANPIARLIKAYLDNYQKQQELLQLANKEQGTKRAEILGKISELEHIPWPKDLLKMIEKADPQDTTGYVRRLKFNMWGIRDMMEKKEEKEILREINKMLSDKAYTTIQKQAMCAYTLQLLRNSSRKDTANDIKKYATRMYKLDPKSYLGQSAASVIRDWVYELSIEDGWSPKVLPDSTEYTEVAGQLPIKSAGTYTVTFEYTSGSDRLNICGVKLYDGSKQIAEDIHDGFSGIQKHKHVYELQVKSSVKKPKLKVSFNMDKKNSHGKIIIKKIK